MHYLEFGHVIFFPHIRVIRPISILTTVEMYIIVLSRQVVCAMQTKTIGGAIIYYGACKLQLQVSIILIICIIVSCFCIKTNVICFFFFKKTYISIILVLFIDYYSSILVCLYYSNKYILFRSAVVPTCRSRKFFPTTL